MPYTREEFLDEVDYDGPEYLVRFALGMPLGEDELQYWTSHRWVEVHARAREAWVSWISDPDPVIEAEWVTRVGRMCWDAPWRAAWEYVDVGWHASRHLERLIKGNEEENNGWNLTPEEEQDDDDQGDAEGVLAGL